MAFVHSVKHTRTGMGNPLRSSVFSNGTSSLSDGVPLFKKDFDLSNIDQGFIKDIRKTTHEESFSNMYFDTIQFNPELGRQIYRFLQPKILWSWKDLSVAIKESYPDIADQIGAFAIPCKWYLLHARGIEDDFSPFLSLLEGPSFAKRLKERRFDYMAECFNSTYITEESENFGTKVTLRTNKVFDYDFYYHPRNCFPWTGVTNDFEEYSYIPSKPIKEEHKNEFRAALKAILKNLSPKKPNYKDILCKITGASALMPNGSRRPQWTSPSKSFSDSLEGQLVVLQKSPADVRDILVTTPTTRNQLVYTNELLSSLVSQLRFSAMKQADVTKITKKFNKRNADRAFYYLRDLKKEGLTKSHQLIHLVAEVLEELYPNYGFKDIIFLTNWDIKDHKGKKLPQGSRGHCLGMGNELTTLIACVFHRILEERLQRTDILDALYYNDDTVIALDREFIDVDEFLITDRQLLSDFDTIQNCSKSLLCSTGFVFCEEYYNYGMHSEKTLTEGITTLKALHCVNITHAKAFINSLSEPNILALEEVVTWWGYEYSPIELKWPYLMGGWKSPINRGLDYTLHYAIDGEFLPGIAQKVASWKQMQIPMKNEFRGEWIHPIIPIYGLTVLKWNQDVKQLLIGNKKTDVGRKFMKLSYAKASMENFWKARQKYTKFDNSWSAYDWIIYVVKEFNHIVFSIPNLPPLIKQREEVFETNVQENRRLAYVLTCDNEIDAYINYLINKGYVQGIKPDPPFDKPNKTSLILSKRAQRTNQTDFLAFLNSENYEFNYPNKYLNVCINSVWDFTSWTLHTECVIDDFYNNFGFYPESDVFKGEPDLYYSNTGIPIEKAGLFHLYNVPLIGYNLACESLIAYYDPVTYEELLEEKENFQYQQPETAPLEEAIDWSYLRRELLHKNDFLEKWLTAKHQLIGDTLDYKTSAQNLADRKLEEIDVSKADDYIYYFDSGPITKVPKEHENVLIFADYCDYKSAYRGDLDEIHMRENTSIADEHPFLKYTKDQVAPLLSYLSDDLKEHFGFTCESEQGFDMDELGW